MVPTSGDEVVEWVVREGPAHANRPVPQVRASVDHHVILKISGVSDLDGGSW